MTKKPHPSIRIFESPLLERLTHVHPVTPLLLWGPVTVWFLWRSFTTDGIASAAVGGLALSGFVVWTLAEYLLHRYIFHIAGESALSKRFQFIIHGLHHDDPVDPTRLVMPPGAAIILAILLYSLFRAVLGAPWADPFFAGFVIGYLCYDYIHYGVHHFNPRSRVGKAIKKHHMLHHFAAHGAGWGVSSPLWDYVFGTMPPLRSALRSDQEPSAARHGAHAGHHARQ